MLQGVLGPRREARILSELSPGGRLQPYHSVLKVYMRMPGAEMVVDGVGVPRALTQDLVSLAFVPKGPSVSTTTANSKALKESEGDPKSNPGMTLHRRFVCLICDVCEIS